MIGLNRVVGLGVALVALASHAATGCGGDTEALTSSSGAGGEGGFVSSVGGSGGCVPEEEICNGLDDDCDGEVDEGCPCSPGDTQSCWSGPPGAEEVGTCTAGTQTCDGSSQWGPCEGEILPVSETCDGLDNDCDGEIDEGFGTVTCGLGICQVTVEECVDGVFTPCIPGTPAPAETCDGTDDDCDGEVDEDCSCAPGEPPQPCYTGSLATKNVGACIEGEQSCVNGSWGSCTGDVTPSAEICDGIDNDCDGMTDEGNPGGGSSCSTNQPGKCAIGTEICQGGQIVCQQNQQPSAELCNGIDDDCDGTVDNGNPGGGGMCSTGLLGVCNVGTFNCSNGMLVCSPNQQPSAEQCNGLDDDCDGLVDENNPGGGGACSTNQLGVCAAGTLSCQGGSLSCQANQSPSAEICNGLDDDCDGAIDEGNPGGGGACNTGLPGKCAPGTLNCQNGSLTCTQNQQPSTEVCNGIDDDCDGLVDEGNPGGGGACATGLPGKCAAGTLSCQNGSLSCNQNQQPSNEVCNGIDDDCDGLVDEGNPGGGGACNTGQAGLCAAGTQQCQNGSLVCQPNQSPTAEVCNGFDDDCDGAIDEGNPGGGASCNTGNLGVCAAGTVTCSAGALGCTQNQGPSPEQCSNGLDDDCDGLTDSSDPDCGCAHPLCQTGAALNPGCNSCVASICAQDPYCCNNQWDSICVSEVRTICGSLTCPESAGSCPHVLCSVGPISTPFPNGCDNTTAACVSQICAVDPFCCNTDWDSLCQGQVSTVCGYNCIYQ